MSESNSPPWPTSGSRLNEGNNEGSDHSLNDDDLSDGLDLAFDGAAMGRCAPQTVIARIGGTRTVPHISDALSARNYGCAVAKPSGTADQLYEGGPGRRDGSRE